jgi:hypothetical protein
MDRYNDSSSDVEPDEGHREGTVVGGAALSQGSWNGSVTVAGGSQEEAPRRERKAAESGKASKPSPKAGGIDESPRKLAARWTEDAIEAVKEEDAENNVPDAEPEKKSEELGELTGDPNMDETLASLLKAVNAPDKETWSNLLWSTPPSPAR